MRSIRDVHTAILLCMKYVKKKPLNNVFLYSMEHGVSKFLKIMNFKITPQTAQFQKLK